MLRLENTPEGRVVSWLLLRDEEQMKMEMREERRGRRGRREISHVVKTFKNT